MKKYLAGLKVILILIAIGSLISVVIQADATRGQDFEFSMYTPEFLMAGISFILIPVISLLLSEVYLIFAVVLFCVGVAGIVYNASDFPDFDKLTDWKSIVVLLLKNIPPIVLVVFSVQMIRETRKN